MIEIEKTGEEIATNSLNITFANAVPNKAKMKIYPSEELTFGEYKVSPHGKLEKNKTKTAGKTIAKKFPEAIPSEEIPFNLYLIIFTLIA